MLPVFDPDDASESAAILAGKRAVIRKPYGFGGDGVGNTGRLGASEDGLVLELDHPRPEWTDSYEYSRGGRLDYFDDFSSLELVDEDYPIHSGAEIEPRKAPRP